MEKYVVVENTQPAFFEWTEKENGRIINCKTGNPLVCKKRGKDGKISYVIVESVTPDFTIEVCSTNHSSQAQRLLKFLREQKIMSHTLHISTDLSYDALFQEVHNAPLIG